MQLKNYKLAVEYYNKALMYKSGIDLNHDFAFEIGQTYDVPGVDIKYQRGIALLYSDSLDKSKQDFQFCISRKFKEAESYYWVGLIYITANQPNLACENLYKAQQMGDKDAEIQIQKYCK